MSSPKMNFLISIRYYSQSKYPQIMGNYEKNSHNLLL